MVELKKDRQMLVWFLREAALKLYDHGNDFCKAGKPDADALRAVLLHETPDGNAKMLNMVWEDWNTQHEFNLARDAFDFLSYDAQKGIVDDALKPWSSWF